MVSDAILTLSACRWNIPVLACLEPAGWATFGTLRRALSVGSSSLARSLRTLARPGWVVAHPPARRGYALTPPGRCAAAASGRILRTVPSPEVEDLILRKWSLPVTAALRGFELSFAEIRALEPGISPRALTLALKGMIACGLVARRVTGGFPPSTAYRLTPRGAAFLPALETLDRCGGGAGPVPGTAG